MKNNIWSQKLFVVSYRGVTKLTSFRSACMTDDALGALMILVALHGTGKRRAVAVIGPAWRM